MNLYVGIDPGFNTSWVTFINDEGKIVLSEYVGFKSYHYAAKDKTNIYKKVARQGHQLKALYKRYPQAKYQVGIEVPQGNWKNYFTAIKIFYIYNLLMIFTAQTKNIKCLYGLNTNIYKKGINQQIHPKSLVRKQISIAWVNNMFGEEFGEVTNHNQADSISMAYFMYLCEPLVDMKNIIINRHLHYRFRKR